MAKKIMGGFMAGITPAISNEPSVVETYRGCSIYKYVDHSGRSMTVMCYPSGSIRLGTDEAYGMSTIEIMSKVFKLEKVMTV